ncbi:MAG: hypothetical protein AB7E95_11080 [Kiritimatiellales bacterium]
MLDYLHYTMDKIVMVFGITNLINIMMLLVMGIYLLKHTALPVSAIVDQTGLPSPTALSRHIQTETGKTLQQLRPANSPISKGQLRGLFNESELS